MLIHFEEGVYGTFYLELFFVVFCVYGWIVWLKRNKKKHRIVRITGSTKKEFLLQILIFALIFIGLCFSLSYLKNYFQTYTHPYLEAFINASSFTGIWLVICKKTTTWFWWIAATLGLLLSYYSRNYLLMSCFYCGTLILCLWGILEWKRRKIIKMNPQLQRQ